MSNQGNVVMLCRGAVVDVEEAAPGDPRDLPCHTRTR